MVAYFISTRSSEIQNIREQRAQAARVAAQRQQQQEDVNTALQGAQAVRMVGGNEGA